MRELGFKKNNQSNICWRPVKEASKRDRQDCEVRFIRAEGLVFLLDMIKSHYLLWGEFCKDFLVGIVFQQLKPPFKMSTAHNSA